MKITALVSLLSSFLCLSLSFNTYADSTGGKGAGYNPNSQHSLEIFNPAVSKTRSEILSELKTKANCSADQAATVFTLLVNKGYLIPDNQQYHFVNSQKSSTTSAYQLIKSNCS